MRVADFTLEQQQAIAKARARIRIDEEARPDVIQPAVPVSETLGALGQVATTFITGAAALPVAGIAGLTQGIASAIVGDQDPVDDATRRIEQVMESLTFEPRTQRAKDTLQFVSIPFEKLFEVADQAGTSVLGATGSPALATATRSAIELSPAAIGLRFPKKSPLTRRRDIRSVDEVAKRLGVDLGAGPGTQKAQLQGFSRKETGQRQVKGQDLEGLQQAVQKQRDLAKTNVDNLYDVARKTKAGIPVEQVKVFPDMVRKALEDFDVETMPIVKRRIAELDKVAELPNGTIKLDAAEKWRKRLNRNKPASTDLSQGAALGILKGQYDNFMDSLFNADMISGDASAVIKWRDARDANAAYRARFKDDKVIRQFVEQQATPEEIRNWIFGASAAGAKKQAGATVESLKRILGEDSPQFAALRQEALMDVLDPLLRKKLSIPDFITRYDKMVKDSPTLVNALFPDSKTALAEVRKLAAAVEGTDFLKIPFALDQAIARATVGHAIAKGGLRVQLATTLIRFIRGAGGKSRRKLVVGEFLGYDPFVPLITKPPIFIAAGVEAGIDIEDRDFSE